MKFRRVVLSILALFCSALILSGCSLFKRPGGDGGNNGGGGGTNNPVVTDPVKKNFTDYFSNAVGVTYLYKIDKLANHNGVEYPFEFLVSQQIELLTQDIIYRLVSVYGAGAPNLDSLGFYEEKTLHLHDTLTNTKYAKGNNIAQVSTFSVISTPSSVTSNVPIYKNSSNAIVTNSNLMLNDPSSFAYSFKTGKWESNNLTNNFKLTHAINGGFTYSNGFTNNFNSSRKWLMANSPDLLLSTDVLNATAVYEDFIAKHKDTIKLSIANILATGVHSGYSYETAIREVDHLGFTDNDKTLITNYVLKYVIGDSNVNYDNSIKPNVTKISGTFTDSQHLYKAYSLLVPKMLEQAFNNTFTNTTTSIWLNASKVSTKTEHVNYNSLRSEQYTSIKITPKTTIPLTKLVLKFNGTYAVHLNVKYSIYRNSSSTIAKDVRASISSNTITLDFSAYKSNNIGTGGYILINFENNGNTPFKITFDGYYDKA